ncbi:CRISPR-associated protein, TM1793 [Acididesulfobacillus acetoxydans]|uniref:CRISPR-associated protein, Cmr3 n=1 Tax=Acididesulfobacillus acetoxydans TaxID=1561005 RepID=A0A8S0Y4A1_9FIRM|nr:type III-B CRISPR module-associated protein Cmr3 [Acididesulfobacillus acetoxydans]CAA7602815.1 CRISPR-associated protein, TM1793 [Acididesulfobacillus acetoxydans]CEJ06012.1 CRISPR-associated protein, Cmr3 [Acididesulfobacillus acetoxydans]
MLLKIKALDPLFFRDGKPFTMGEDFWAEGFFPPFPSVFYGALRTAFFAENPSFLPNATTDKDPTLNLRIRSILLMNGETIYFPCPLDVVKDKEETEVQRAYPLQLSPAGRSSNYFLPQVLTVPEGREAETLSGALLERLTFIDYLSGSQEALPYRMISEFVTEEPKIGITLDRQYRRAEGHKLYRIGMKRLAPDRGSGLATKETSFLVDYEGLELPNKGFIRLGGEGKVAGYETIERKWLPQPAPFGEKRFKLYLLTPAVLANGWLPEWLNEKDLTGNYRGLSLRLLTAAIDKYVSVGGFNIKENSPKPMKRAVPAGSVYCFELLDGDPEQVQDIFHYRPMEENSYSREGFGTVLVGGVST